MWEKHLQLLHFPPCTYPHSPPRKKEQFLCKLGERLWPAGLSSHGGASLGLLLLQHGKLPGQPSLQEGVLHGAESHDWEEGVASGIKCGHNSPSAGVTDHHLSPLLNVSVRSELRRQRGLLGNELLPPNPTC